MGGRWLMRGGAGTALVGDGPTVAARITNMPRLASTALCFRAIRIWKSVSGRRVAVPTSGCRHSGNSQPQPLNPQGEAVANDFIPRESRKAKEHDDGNASEEVVIAVAPWFLPVGIVAVWQLASSVAGCRRVFCLHRKEW